MSFAETCKNIKLSGNELSADCLMGGKAARDDQDSQHSKINLNAYLGNDNGSFTTNFAGFADSATEVRLDLEGGVVLKASLKKSNGSWEPASYNLEEHIANINGTLTFNRD